MKKIIAISISLLILISSLVVLFFFDKGDNCDFLINGNWECYDQNIGETIRMTFNKDGEYFYNCACGEPVGDSDAYDSYKYDANEKVIKLSGPDTFKSEIKILYWDEFYLVLKFPEYTRVFENAEKDIEEISYKKSVGLEKETPALFTALGFKNGELKVAPFNYDGDARGMFKENIFTLKVAENATFKTISETFVNDKRTERDEKVLTEKDYEYFGEYYSHGYTLFNDNGEIQKIIFYGRTEVFE